MAKLIEDEALVNIRDSLRIAIENSASLRRRANFSKDRVMEAVYQEQIDEYRGHLKGLENLEVAK